MLNFSGTAAMSPSIYCAGGAMRKSCWYNEPSFQDAAGCCLGPSRTSAMGDGVDGPHRHRLCQNEVVADLKQRGPSVRAHVKSRRDDRGATREAQPPGPDERVATPEYFAGRAEAAV